MAKFDTYAETTYLVRLAQDAKVFKRDDGGEDVSLTFVDDSRIEGTEQLWVDCRVAKFQAERAAKYMKGDEVQIRGKLRFKIQKDGSWRGKIYDGIVHSFVKLSERQAGEPATATVTRPTFE